MWKKFSLAALAGSAFLLAQAPYLVSIEPSDIAHDIPANKGAAALYQSLKKLGTRASLIMITAHPDDEDGGMLAYESRGQGTRVALLTLNRGEGGANVMSNDYFDALGLVRTMELLTAGRYYGVQQYWTRVVDYGFSKTKAESISRWTHERVLADAVRTVRTVRPLVVTSVFIGGPSDGHGNHQTAGAMAQEVFKAAGDANMFPDQIAAGLQPWSPVKVYARQPFGRRGGASPLSVNVEVPEGMFDPLLGASYVQLAREGLGFQTSQNGGASIPKDGPLTSNYHRFGSTIDVPEKESGFFEGIDVSVGGIAALAGVEPPPFLRTGLTRMDEAAKKALASFSATEPDRCAPALADGVKATEALLAEAERSSLPARAKFDVLHELKIKRAQFNNALAQSLGLSVEGIVAPNTEPNPMMVMFMGNPETFRTAIPGQTFAVNVHAAVTGKAPVTLKAATLESYGGQPWPVKGAAAKGLDQRFQVTVPDGAPYTRPYFARPDIEQSYYDVDAKYAGRPLAPYPLAAWADFTYNGVDVRVGRYVQTVKRIIGQGSVQEPLVVGPPIGVAISPRAGVVPLDAKSFSVTALLHSNVKGEAKGDIKLELPSGWTAQPPAAPFQTGGDGQDQSVTFTVTPRNLAEQSYKITAAASYNGKTYTEGYQTTGYPGLRPYFLYRPATYSTSGVDVKIAPELKIAYVMGSGDDVPSSLEHLGVHVSNLDAGEIAGGNLSRFDAIVLGVRTYAARPELRTYNGRLLDYVKNGGVVIVQYNTPEFDGNFGPYPYKMGNDPEEVTDEQSKVQILEPGNPLFQWPNKIGEKDFEGWVEERGSKWMKSWHPQYQALLEAHDEGQEPQKGGLLYAKYGKGIYIYNAYAFYRQLPEGVPGAYRIFANMLSLPKNPALH